MQRSLLPPPLREKKIKGIKVDVKEEVQKMSLASDMNELVPTFKERAFPFVFLVKILSITNAKAPHELEDSPFFSLPY